MQDCFHSSDDVDCYYSSDAVHCFYGNSRLNRFTTKKGCIFWDIQHYTGNGDRRTLTISWGRMLSRDRLRIRFVAER